MFSSYFMIALRGQNNNEEIEEAMDWGLWIGKEIEEIQKWDKTLL